MDARRPSRTVIDPKVRQVGFFAPHERSQSYPLPSSPERSPSSPPTTGADVIISPSGNSLSPVMIPPPPRHSSPGDVINVVGSYDVANDDGSEVLLSSSLGWIGRRKSAELGRVYGSSLPSGGFELTAAKQQQQQESGVLVAVAASPLTTVSVVHMPLGLSEKGRGASAEVLNERTANSKPPKEQMSKAERRALQESQRAAKAAARGQAEVSKTSAATSGVVTSANVKPAKSSKPHSQKKDTASVSASEKKGVDRPQEKDRKKDVPQPRMQFDDRTRVEKAKRRAVVKQTEAKNRVELFRHLPQYEHGTQLPDLESKFYQLDPMHPAVYKVGLQYLAGDISGGNARCIAMLQAFQEAIKDYTTPSEKTIVRDLTSKISSYVSFLNECRPLSISMGNAIRFLKSRLAKFPPTLPELEVKSILQSEIDNFINEKIILADKVIVKHAVTKIRDGDVLLTHGSSSAVEMIFVHAHEIGKQFRVVIVDSRPKLEGKFLLRRLVEQGISCTYTNINAVSYIMHEVTKVFLGAASVLANGAVYSRVGTACVAMVAHAFRVPVLVCCEAYKFHERVQLDSICSNELGNPDLISKVCGREEIDCLDDCANSENLQFLNLNYDATPSDYVSMIITDYGMVPPTSVPVIVREYRKEHLWI